MTPLKPESKVYDWSKARYDLFCDYCGREGIGVIVGTSDSICASCADADKLQDWKNYAEDLEKKWKEALQAEHDVSDAYVRLRVILGAMNPPSLGLKEIAEYTEDKAKGLVSATQSTHNREVLYLLRENKDLRDKLKKHEKFLLAVAKGIDILQENGDK